MQQIEVVVVRGGTVPTLSQRRTAALQVWEEKFPAGVALARWCQRSEVKLVVPVLEGPFQQYAGRRFSVAALCGLMGDFEERGRAPREELEEFFKCLAEENGISMS